MSYARYDVTCEFWIEGFNHAIYASLGTHATHMLLLGDFVYYHFKTLCICLLPFSVGFTDVSDGRDPLVNWSSFTPKEVDPPSFAYALNQYAPPFM